MLRKYVVEARPGLWVNAVKGKQIGFTQYVNDALVLQGAVKTLGTALIVRKMFPKTVKIIDA